MAQHDQVTATINGGHSVPSGSTEVSIIIVNWNSKEFVRQCLRSIFRHTRGNTFEVVVIDGASFDGCDQMVASEFPTAIFIQSPENVGFARANNLGAGHANGDCLLFLNPDTELIEDSIQILFDRMKSLPEAGLVGCRLLNEDRTLQTSCIQTFPTILNQVLDCDFLRFRFPRSRLWGTAAFLSRDGQPEKVEVISGACMFIKRRLFEQVGGFTEEYFMFGEDLDLCYKITRAGAQAYYVPETAVVHYGGRSTQTAGNQFSNVMMRESIHRFLRQNRGRVNATLYRLAMGVSSLVRLVFMLPLLLISGNQIVRHGTGSAKKWFAILRWSLGAGLASRSFD